MSELPPPPPPSGPGDSVPPPPPPPAYPGQPSSYPESGGNPRFTGGLGFEPLGRRARIIAILVGVVAAVQIASIPVELAIGDKAEKFRNGTISLDSFKDALNKQQGLAGLQNGAQLAAGILTILLLRRMIRNHRALGRPGAKWGPGWAIGGWLIPTAVIPWLILKELWKGSDPQNLPNDPSWRQRAVSPLVHAWWVVFGLVPIALVGSNVAVALNTVRDAASRGRTELETYETLADIYSSLQYIQVSVGIAIVVAAVLFAKVIIDLSRRQQALIGER